MTTAARKKTATAAPAVKPESDLPDETLPWAIAWPGVVLMATKEGLGPAWKKQRRVLAYLCPAGVPTIGWGETAGVYLGMEWTKAQADQNLSDRIAAKAQRVSAMLTKPANQYQLAALVAFADNIGLGAASDTKSKKGFYWSSVRRLHNAGDFAGAAKAFGLQNQVRNPATKKLEASRGLTIRRAQEAALYVTPDPNEINDDSPGEAMPQDVAAESSMASSPINGTQVIAGAAGAGSILKGLSDGAEPAKAALDGVQGVAGSASGVMGTAREFAGAFGFSLDLSVVIGIVIVVCAGVAIYYRFKQRRAGWA